MAFAKRTSEKASPSPRTQKKAAFRQPFLCLKVSRVSLSWISTRKVSPWAIFSTRSRPSVTLPKHVVAIQVRRVLAVVHDEELRASRVAAGVGHAQHPFVVVLVVPVQLAVDGVPGSATADALGHPPCATNPGITR